VFVFAINVFAAKPLSVAAVRHRLAVGMAPELLPAVITITLSRAQQMAAKGVIVRRLNAIENFGNMDVLPTKPARDPGTIRLSGGTMLPEPSEEVSLYAYLNAHFQMGIHNPWMMPFLQ
jgi:Mg2+-importing ATPase